MSVDIGDLAFELSELKFDNEAMGLIVRGQTLEIHDFALACRVSSYSVDDQLSLVFGVLDSKLSHLLDVRDVSARNASDITAIRIGFSDKGYRLLADAAKDRVANPIYRD